MRYVPLGDFWPAHGLASVVCACLQDAGFHPALDCDPRGWMHFRGWPLGSHRPLTLWIPDSELDDASAFLQAPFELEGPEEPEPAGFWWQVRRYRSLVFVVWLLVLLTYGAT